MADTRPAPDTQRLLSIYLQDHHAGSSGGLALVRRMMRSNEGDPLHALLVDLHAQIGDDRRALESMMSALGVARSRYKSALASCFELIGRLKPNGRIVGYSPLSRVLELEALASAVLMKRSLWRTLRSLAAHVPALDAARLDELERRAVSQYEQLLEAHGQATAVAFGAAGSNDDSRARSPGR